MARLDPDPLSRITAEAARVAADIAELAQQHETVEVQLADLRQIRDDLLGRADALNRARLISTWH
jgi:hypothetical protein